MSLSLISRSLDLRKLADDGYDIDIVSGHLVIRDVPYVNANRDVKRGVLASTLDLAGDTTARPTTHVAMFGGEYPCDRSGLELAKIRHGSRRQAIAEGLAVDHSFSSKPPDGYEDYYHKMTTYVGIISAPQRPSTRALLHDRGGCWSHVRATLHSGISTPRLAGRESPRFQPNLS